MADEDSYLRTTEILCSSSMCLQYVVCSGCIATRMVKFLRFLWRDQNNMHAQYINLMYELDSTFGSVSHLGRRPVKGAGPVESAAEIQQLNQTSNFCRINLIQSLH